MMICKADFEELFPETFRSHQRPLAGRTVGNPSPACLARWEDDGGRPSRQLPRCGVLVDRRANDGYPVPDPMRTSLALATMPAAAVYGAIWTTLSNFGRPTGR